MRIALVFVLCWTVPFSVCLFPDDQPGCIFRPEANLFYAYNAHLGPNPKNWLCDDESFEERLKICIDVYQRTTQGKVETSYAIVKDNQSVSTVCEKRKMTFTQEFESGEPEFDTYNLTIRNVTIEVNMFACPITKMDLRYPVPYLKPELFDIYISLGRNDVTIAALIDSVYEDNICVRNVYLYPPAHLRSSTPRSQPNWPDEIRDYKHMDDEYFQRLANKLYSRKMATATGAMFDYWSTVLHNFTNKPTTEVAETATFEPTSLNTSAQSADADSAGTSGGGESSEGTSTEDGTDEEMKASAEDGSREQEASTESISEKISTAMIDQVTQPENAETETTTLGNSDTDAHSHGTSDLSATEGTTTVAETKASKKGASRKARVTKVKKTVSRKARVTKSKTSSKKAKATKSKKTSKKAKVSKSATAKRTEATKAESSTTPA